jgi:hypothetical protein
MSTEKQQACLLDHDPDGGPYVWVAVTHDNRFIGAFATEEAAKDAAGPANAPFVGPEFVDAPPAPTAGQKGGPDAGR